MEDKRWTRGREEVLLGNWKKKDGGKGREGFDNIQSRIESAALETVATTSAERRMIPMKILVRVRKTGGSSGHQLEGAAETSEERKKITQGTGGHAVEMENKKKASAKQSCTNVERAEDREEWAK